MISAPSRLLLDSNVWIDLFASDRPGRWITGDEALLRHTPVATVAPADLLRLVAV